MKRILLVLALLPAALTFADRTIPAMPGELVQRVDAAISDANAAIDAIIAVPDDHRTYQNTLGALDDLAARLDEATNLSLFLAYVHPDAPIRDAAQASEQAWSNWAIDVGKNEPLYRAIRSWSDTQPTLEGEQARLLAFTLRDYRRSGMELDREIRDELKAVQQELSALSIEFEANIRNDETMVPLTREELAGVPEDVLSNLKEISGVLIVGMDNPTFSPILDYCTNATTRQKVWVAYKRRGGEANVAVLEKIIALRATEARLLGYATPAHYEIEVRMARSPERVAEFYATLQPLLREKALQDWDELLAAKRADTGDAEATFYPWDWGYYMDKLKRDTYAVDSQIVQEYLPLQSVMDGLFAITQQLYGIEYRDVTDAAEARGTPLWHEDARVFEVWDTTGGEQLGEFYLDLHPRPNKYSHAAQWGLMQHKVWSDGSVRRPVAALVCNFTKPTETKPSLLTHRETETFFHEFGHCLHTILSEATTTRFAGTGVERDFVEAPSQMFEEWVWTPDTLQLFARHYETGEPMPDALIEGMLAARNLGSGMMAEHQVFYGRCDQAYHSVPSGEVDTTAVGLDVFAETELFEAVPGTWFQAGFGHLTGYQAGYYGYLWSEVFAKDMFQRFEELGMLSPEAGAYYRRTILSKGGTLDGLDLVKGYLGREPSMDAYLASLGLSLDASGEQSTAVDLPGAPCTGSPSSAEDGLRWWDLFAGSGDTAAANSTYLSLHFEAWLDDGTPLGSTREQGGPQYVPLAVMPEAWRAGIASMREQGRRKLVIPAALAFSRGTPAEVASDAFVVYDIELIGIDPYAKVPPMSELPGDPASGEASTSESGLTWYDLIDGDGAQPAGATSTVKVHYTGWLVDGTKFDSSVDRGEAISFPLNGVIRGWTEGVGSMRVGGKRKLVIPAELGYGERGSGGTIPPGATLVFDVELLSVTD